jgi:putative transposase
MANERERYQHRGHTVVDLKYHFVWKTKYSYKVLNGDIGLRTRAIIREICVQKGITIVRGNICSNHIHILVSAPTYMSPAKIAQYLKGISSHQLQNDFPELRKKYWGQHLWSRGYFCSTVGAVTEEMIKKYIDEQDSEEAVFHVWDDSKVEEKMDGSSTVSV